MATKQLKPTDVISKIKQAMDGRTQRWLSKKTMIPEVDLSNKLSGVREFTDDDKKKIAQALSITI
jgi:hypothetical protein